MRRRLEQLLNESFEYDPPRLRVEPAALEGSAQEGEILRGSVLVSHPEGKRCKGFVYSSNVRVLPQPADFYSPKSEIRYQVDLTGLAPGRKVEGALTICSELGEVSVVTSAALRLRQTLDPLYQLEDVHEPRPREPQESCVFFNPEIAASVTRREYSASSFL